MIRPPRHHLTTRQREEHSAPWRFWPLICIVIGLAIAAPISIFVFDRSIWDVLDRAYYMLGGGFVVLFVQAKT